MALVEKVILPNGEVTWRGNEVLLKLEGVTADTIAAAAFSVEGRFKQFIESKGYVDTGFMINSTGTILQDGKGSYGKGAQSGSYPWDPAKHEGQSGQVEQELLPPAPLPDDGMTAIVQVGAGYYIFIEIKDPSLYPALEEEAKFFGIDLSENAKEAGF